MSYNGYTNYATWRLSLEWIDGNEETFSDIIKGMGTSDSIDAIRDYVEESLSYDADDSTMVYQYAISFLSDVNWYEIVEKVDEWYQEHYCSNCGEPKDYDSTHCSKSCAMEEKAAYVEE